MDYQFKSRDDFIANPPKKKRIQPLIKINGKPFHHLDLLTKDAAVKINDEVCWGMARSDDLIFSVGDDYSSEVKISVGAPDEGLSFAIMGIITIVIIGLLGGVFVYFFVEIEDEENSEGSSDDTESTEGWIWDENSNEWIEDPNYKS